MAQFHYKFVFSVSVFYILLIIGYLQFQLFIFKLTHGFFSKINNKIQQNNIYYNNSKHSAHYVQTYIKRSFVV